PRLSDETASPTGVPRHRVEFRPLRNLALAGDEAKALEGLAHLLEQELPVELRLRVYNPAISIAANLEQWPRAFAWLGEGLSYLPQAPSESAGLLRGARYLHTRAGETG